MKTSRLSQQALAVINQYVHLSIGGKTISCPYYNNQRHAARGALRVRVGKGDPEEITQEAQALALHEGVALDHLSEEQIRKFLVEHGLGVDCSALVYYVLAAEAASRGKRLDAEIKIASTSIFRKIITRLRVVENTNVKTIASEANSKTVDLNDVQAADCIVLLGYDDAHVRDHILVVTSVQKINGQMVIEYAHSTERRIDGTYNHGIVTGAITVVDEQRSLTEQVWEESGKSGENNETLAKARNATVCEIRRLHLFA